MSRLPKAFAVVASIRIGEVLVLQGAPLIGIVFSIGTITAPKLLASLIFAAASFLLVAHIFTLNDWADFSRGLNHSNSAMSRLENKKVPPRLLFFFSLLLLMASLSLFLSLSVRCSLLAAGIATLGILYSHPLLNFKSIPIVSSLVHFVGGLLHFLLGYALFSAIDEHGLLIGSFFAVTFTAGHLNQELRDFDLDQQTGARTNAVVFGKRIVFMTGLILFTISYIYLFFLAWTGVTPRSVAILPVLLCPVHIVASLHALKAKLTSKSIRRFQALYRVNYALIGLTMLVVLLYR
ncbi:MAG: UbiA family prenyltransferase [Verrucomicrobiota bacterium]